MILFEKNIFSDWYTRPHRGLGSVYSLSFFQAAYNRTRFFRHRFPKYVLGEDIVYLFGCLRKAQVIAKINKPIYCYRLRNGSASRSKWTFRKRWDDLKHAIHCFLILLFTPKAPPRIYLRYLRRVGEKTLSLLGELV